MIAVQKKVLDEIDKDYWFIISKMYRKILNLESSLVFPIQDIIEDNIWWPINMSVQEYVIGTWKFNNENDISYPKN